MAKMRWSFFSQIALQMTWSLTCDLWEDSATYYLNGVVFSSLTLQIKLMIADNVESKMDQLTAVKDNTVRLYDDYKSKGTQTFVDAKQVGVEKVQAVLETPYGQKLNQTVEQGLTMADSVVDRFLPEGRKETTLLPRSDFEERFAFLPPFFQAVIHTRTETATTTTPTALTRAP
jgi:hypothetical protein